MSEGFIKLDRALNNWRFKRKPNYVALWVHMLQLAFFKDGKDGTVEVKRGQFVASVKELSSDTGLTVQQVRTILKHLDGEEITIKTTSHYSLITIVKYDEYQGSGEQINKQINTQSTNNQQTTNNYIRKKESKKEINNYIYDPSRNPIISRELEEELEQLIGKAEA